MVAASPRARLDDVGIQRALHEKASVLDIGRHLFEDADERLPDGLALGFGIGDTGQKGEEPIGRFDVDQVHVELAPKRLLDLVGLAGAHEARVDEHTRELVADGPVHEGGGHGRVHPARQGTQDAGVGDLGAHRLDRRLDDVGVRPQRTGTTHVEEEAFQQLLSPLGVDDLGMELDSVDLALRVAQDRHGCFGCRCVGHEAGGDLGDRVGMAHPHVGGALGRPVREQRGRGGARERGASVLAATGAGHGAAELLGEQLGAVTDSEDRDA